MYIPRQGDIVVLQHPAARVNGTGGTCPAIVQQVTHTPDSPVFVAAMAFPLDGVPVQIHNVPFYRLIPDTRDPSFTGCWPTSHDHRMHLADPDEDATI